jgi:hypothetical protein
VIDNNTSLDAREGAERLDLPAVEGAQAAPAQPGNGETTGNGGAERAPLAGGPIIRCGATTKAGRACVNRAGVDGYCVTHTQDPQVRAMVLAGKAAGGRAPRIRAGLNLAAPDAVQLDTVEGAVALLEGVVRAVAVNRISGTQAQAITSAVRVALQAQEMVASAQIAELQARLDQLTQEFPRGRR